MTLCAPRRATPGWPGTFFFGESWAVYDGPAGTATPHEHLAVQVVVVRDPTATVTISAGGLLTARTLVVRPLVRSRGDLARDTVHALVNEAALVASVALIPWLLALAPGLHVWPGGWPLGLQLALAVVLADLGITLAHVASHRTDILWRLHAVHHSVGRMYGFNGLMKHPLHQAIEMLAGTTPLVLAGMPADVGVLLGFTVAIQLLLQHSNVDMRVGVLARVWAVAPVHRHHHLADAREGDVNFGLFLTVWDRLLGTYVADRPSPRDGAIGLAGCPDFPSDYVGQLVSPFRRPPPAIAKEDVADVA